MLIQAGVRPTLIARHPAKLDRATSERADVVEADLSDAGAVVLATRDADALLWVAPPTDDPSDEADDQIAAAVTDERVRNSFGRNHRRHHGHVEHDRCGALTAGGHLRAYQASP